MIWNHSLITTKYISVGKMRHVSLQLFTFRTSRWSASIANSFSEESPRKLFNQLKTSLNRQVLKIAMGTQCASSISRTSVCQPRMKTLRNSWRKLKRRRRGPNQICRCKKSAISRSKAKSRRKHRIYRGRPIWCAPLCKHLRLKSIGLRLNLKMMKWLIWTSSASALTWTTSWSSSVSSKPCYAKVTRDNPILSTSRKLS